MIRTRKQLREIADEKGFLCRKGCKTPAVRIWEDGSISRIDVDLSLARNMTVKEAVSFLRI